MSKKMRVACSPLTKTIYAGTLIKNNTMWGTNKQEVTMDCLIAVVDYCLRDTGTVQISLEDGTVEFEISVKDLRVK